AKLVQRNLSLCEKEPPKTDAPPRAEPASCSQPEVVTNTVTREVGHTDTLAVSLVTIGALGIGAAGGLYVAAHANRLAAPTQRTLEDSNHLYDRADSEQKAMYAAGVIGIALVGYGMYRLTSGSSSKADV